METNRPAEVLLQCAVHPPAVALGACPRCGSFVCRACVAEGQGLSCARCRSVPPPKPPRSKLLYVAAGVGGCGGLLLLLVVVVIAGVGLAMASLKKGMAEVQTETDPAEVAATATKMLGALPPGYVAGRICRIPQELDLAMLGPSSGDRPRLFMFVRVPAGVRAERARAFFEAPGGDPALLEGTALEAASEEVVARGRVTTAAGAGVKYVAFRGTANVEALHGAHFGRLNSDGTPNRDQAINTLMYFECPGDGALRLGVWIEEDPSQALPAVDLKLAGTVADDAEVSTLVAPLAPCAN